MYTIFYRPPNNNWWLVEIDESKFGRRKYNRGQHVDGHWVFGGTERGAGNYFMVEVADRSASTLLPIIFKHLRPGTTIISDEWRAYSSLASRGMIHLTVNHSLNFVNPNNGAHTQSIESTWSQVKRMMRSAGVTCMNTSSDLFPTYLQEFIWRRKFKDTDHFEAILDAIKEQYPLS